jgi:hypothetical protein
VNFFRRRMVSVDFPSFTAWMTVCVPDPAPVSSATVQSVQKIITKLGNMPVDR